MVTIVVTSSKMLLSKHSNVFASTGHCILSSLFYSLTISSGWLYTEEKRLHCTATAFSQLTSRRRCRVLDFSSSFNYDHKRHTATYWMIVSPASTMVHNLLLAPYSFCKFMQNKSTRFRLNELLTVVENRCHASLN